MTAVDNTTGAPVPARCNESPTSCLAVFGVRFALADDAYAAAGASPIVSLLVDHVPATVGAEAATSLPDAQLDLRSLLPAHGGYFQYPGSLTTPGCGEGVAWHLFAAARHELSAAQLNALQAALASVDEGEHEQGARTNNRALQPVNDRPLYYSAK